MSLSEAEAVIVAEESAVWPWQDEPYKLWSLLDMLIFSANAFFWCGGALRSIRGDCLAASAICVDGEPGFFFAKPIDSAARSMALSKLETVEAEFRKIGMAITADTVTDSIRELKIDGKQTFEWLKNEADSIERLANKELNNKLFLHVPPEHAKFWPTKDAPNLFGDPVADAFPNSARDISAAGRSLALSEGTACVSHLMRALESPLQSFAKRVGVAFPAPTDLENWKTIVDQMVRRIDDEVKRLEGTTKSHERNAELQLLGDIALDFRHFKNAWRNGVAHGRDWYDEPEARRVYDAVKHFMQKMAEVA